MIIALAVAAAALPRLSAVTPSCSGQPSIAISGVTVVHPEVVRSQPNQTVLVNCGRIEAVGPAGRIRIPKNARHIVGKGRFLSPGLVDAHGHGTEIDWYRVLYLAYGVTTVRNPQTADGALEASEATAAGKTPGPTVYLAGNAWHGDEPEWKGKSVQAAAREIVHNEKLAGFEYTKTYYQLTPQQFDALTAASRQEGLVPIGHVPRAVTLNHALTRLWSIEHLTGFDDALEDPARHVAGPGSAMLSLRRFAAADKTRIVPLAKAVAKSGVWQVPTLFTYDIWAHPAEMRRMASDSEIAELVGQDTVAQWVAPNPWYVTTPDKQTDADRSAIADAVIIRAKMVKALYDAGARLAVGTDASEVYVIPGISLHQEMRLYEKAGIPRAAILKMATVNGAKISRHAGEFGTVTVGERADLLLLDGNPLKDLSTLERPAIVIAAGRIYSRSDLDSMVAEVRAKHRVGDVESR